MRAYIIVDLGFGDAGKGLLTDFLVRHLNAGLVVRYNGGAQAGHNVVAPDGRHHTFSQFGSGTFVPGVKTYLSKHVVIHPTALLVEGDRLVSLGVRDTYSRLRLSDQAIVITPFHQAANRIQELLRGSGKHGSCGVGVGEAVQDALSYPDQCVRAGDLLNPSALRRKLYLIRDRKRGELGELGGDSLQRDLFAREMAIFEKSAIVEIWLSTVSRIVDLGLIVPDAELGHWLRQAETLLFEGAQGILLDENFGFHPYTTWSNCTTANAHAILKALAPDSQVFQIGVMRAYTVRHGPGPLPTETDALAPLVFDHNKYNEWQGPVRYGWFDAVFARYALSVSGKLDSLAVTHLDLLPRLKSWNYCNGYAGQGTVDNSFVESISKDVVASMRATPSLPIPEREKLTQAVMGASPVLETSEAGDRRVVEKIESLLGLSVSIVSRGPSAGDIQILNSLPA